MVGIVVLNYETWEISIRCLQSIHRTCEGYPYRIYLVDNDSKRPMPRQIRNELCKRKEQVCLIKAGQNRGYAAGNNLGMRQALADQCEVIVIANNDILFQKQAIQRLAAFLKKYPKVGIAGPKIVNEKGEVQISRFGMYTGIQEMFQIYTAAKKIFCKKWNRYYCLDRDADKASYVYAVSGCCFAVSRECAKVIFPLDEQTVLYFEEPIIGIRMEKAGYRTCYLPHSVAAHVHGATTGQRKPFMYQCIGQSELYYSGTYAQANWWELFFLYLYREVLYLLHCMTDREFRHCWKSFHTGHRTAFYKARRQVGS